MAFFASAIDTLKILVIALGAGLGAWGVVNLLEGYGNDNPGAKAHRFHVHLQTELISVLYYLKVLIPASSTYRHKGSNHNRKY